MRDRTFCYIALSVSAAVGISLSAFVFYRLNKIISSTTEILLDDTKIMPTIIEAFRGDYEHEKPSELVEIAETENR